MTTRIALIGCGSIARRAHLPAFKRVDGVDVVAFASRTITSAEAACAEWGNGTVHADWRKVLKRDDVDAVDICSPNAFHGKQAVAAARAGKHVLVEKPMAHKLKDADRMIEAAEENNVVLHVAHNVRYLPAVAGVRAAVERLGNIVAIRSAFGHSGPREWAPDSTWFFDPERSGGGALIDLGIHAIDLVRYVTRLDVTEVLATTQGDDPVEDAAQVIMRFENAAIGTLHASWVAHPAPDFELTIFGDLGTIRFGATRTPLLLLATGEKEEIPVGEASANPYEDFVRVIRGDEPSGPAGSGPEGRAALAVVRAAYRSARTRKVVEVER